MGAHALDAELRLRHGRRSSNRPALACDARSRQIGADAELWPAATAVEIAGVSTRVPAAADQLLHVVAHAMRWDPRPSYRWVLDAWLLLTEPLNFDRLIEQARRRRLSVPLHAGLSYLASTFAAPIPAEVIAALDPAEVHRSSVPSYARR